MTNNTEHKITIIFSEEEICLSKINAFLTHLDNNAQEEEYSNTILTLRENIRGLSDQEQKRIIATIKTNYLDALKDLGTLKDAKTLMKLRLKQLKYILKIVYYKPADATFLLFLTNFKADLTLTLPENNAFQNSNDIAAFENLVEQSRQTIRMYHIIYLSQNEENTQFKMQQAVIQLINKNPALIYSLDHENRNVIESRLHKEGKLESTYGKQHENRKQQLRNTLTHWITTNGIAHFLGTLDIKAIQKGGQRDIELKQALLRKALYARLGDPETDKLSEEQTYFIKEDLTGQIQKVINDHPIVFLEQRLSFLLNILQYKRSDNNLIMFFEYVTTQCIATLKKAQPKTFVFKLFSRVNDLVDKQLLKQNTPAARCINQLEKYLNVTYWAVAYVLIKNAGNESVDNELRAIADLLTINPNLIFSTNHQGLNILETCLHQRKNAAIDILFNSIDLRPLLSKGFVFKHLKTHESLRTLMRALSIPCISKKINRAWRNNSERLIINMKQYVNKTLMRNRYIDKNKKPCIKKFLEEYPCQETNIKNDKLIILTELIFTQYMLFQTKRAHFTNNLSQKKLAFLNVYFNKDVLLSLINSHTCGNETNIPIESTKILLIWLLQTINIRPSPFNAATRELLRSNQDIDILQLITTCEKKQQRIPSSNKHWVVEAILKHTWGLVKRHNCDDIDELMSSHDNPQSSVIIPQSLASLISSHFDVFGYTKDTRPPEVKNPFLKCEVLQYNRLFCTFLHYVRSKNLGKMQKFLLSKNGALLLKFKHKHKKNLLHYLTPKSVFDKKALLFIFSHEAILSQLDHTAFVNNMINKNSYETYDLFSRMVTSRGIPDTCKTMMQTYKSAAHCFYVLKKLTPLLDDPDNQETGETSTYENNKDDTEMNCFIIDQVTPTTKAHQQQKAQGSASQQNMPRKSRSQDFKQFINNDPNAIIMARKRKITYSECILKIAAKQWMQTCLSNQQLKLFFIVQDDRKLQAEYVNTILRHCKNANRSSFFEQDQMAWLSSQGGWGDYAKEKTENTHSQASENTGGSNLFSINGDKEYLREYNKFIRNNSNVSSTDGGLAGLLRATSSSGSSSFSNNPYRLLSRPNSHNEGSSKNNKPSNRSTSADLSPKKTPN